MGRRGCSAALPLFEGLSEDIRLDLEGYLIDCSALVLVYGEASPSWVRGQLRLFDKLSSRRDRAPRVLAIYAGPPEEKPDLGVVRQDIRFIDARKNASATPVVDFIREFLS